MTKPHDEEWTTGEGALGGALYCDGVWIGAFPDAKRARLAKEAPALVRALLAEGSVLHGGPRDGQWHDYACHGESLCPPVCARKRAPLLAAGAIS